MNCVVSEGNYAFTAEAFCMKSGEREFRRGQNAGQLRSEDLSWMEDGKIKTFRIVLRCD